MNQIEGITIDVSDGVALDIDGVRFVVERLEYARTPQLLVVYAREHSRTGERRRISIPFPREFAEKVFALMGQYMGNRAADGG